MLTVTDAATARLAQMLDGVHAEDGVVARLVPEGEDGIAMQPGAQESGDTAYDHDGRVVLVLDRETSAALESYVLDASSEEGGFFLQVLEPQSVSSAAGLL